MGRNGHEPLAMMPWWVERWRGSKAVDLMSLEAQGCYRNLLDAAWLEPDCALADDDETLRKLAKATPEEWLRVRAIVLTWFDRSSDGKLCNAVAFQEWKIALKRREAARRKGRKGGIKSGLRRRSRGRKGTNLGFVPASTRVQAGAKPPSPSPSRSPSPSNGLRTTDPPPSAPPPEPPPTAATETEARAKAVEVLGDRAMAPDWNREAADDFAAVYGGRAPAQFFAQVKPVAKRFGWRATRPVLKALMAETPLEYLAIPKCLAVKVEQSQNGHHPPARAGPGKVQSVGEKSLSAMERFGARGGELDRSSDVREGPGPPVRRLPPGSG